MAAKKGRQVHLMEAFDAVEAMRHVTIAPDAEAEGAVAALVEAVTKYIAWQKFEYLPGTGSSTGKKLWADILAALARFEVDADAGAEEEAGGEEE